ncbi:MAG: hypothetical protein K8U57_32850, partial [Planctomycetes bacterium]|nr:hypothetical protein [Planctomycetota bacterium]
MPKVPSIARKFNPISSKTASNMLTFETTFKSSRSSSERSTLRLFTYTPTDSGNSIVNSNG